MRLEVTMKTRYLAGLIGAGLLLTPLAGAANSRKTQNMSADMRAAIAWEHHKDEAAARQARIEARHPTVTYNNNANSANRTTDESTQGRPVKDPGPPVRRDK
jgi:hypothetical protein